METFHLSISSHFCPLKEASLERESTGLIYGYKDKELKGSLQCSRFSKIIVAGSTVP